MVFKCPPDNLYWSYGSLFASMVVFGVVLIYSHNMSSFQNQFFERDPSLSQYDRNGQQVSTAMLYEITVGVSVGILIIVSIFTLKAEKLQFYWFKGKNSNAIVTQKLNFFLLFGMGLCCAIFSTEAANTILKNVVGRPRPSAFYLCNYKGYADAVNSGDYSSYDASTVANAEGFVSNCLGSYVDAWSSFPSGHASMSGTTMAFSTLLLRNLLEIDERVFMSFNNMVAFFPMIISAWICVSRLVDRRHHPDDVLTGFIIGATCAIMAYSTVNNIFKRCVNYKDDNDDSIMDSNSAMHHQQRL